MINLTNLYNEIVEQSKYTIYCDLDGVLVDFDKGYEKLTGKHTSHTDVQTKSTFWRAFNHSLLVKNISEQEYWSKLDWMADGKELWNYEVVIRMRIKNKLIFIVLLLRNH